MLSLCGWVGFAQSFSCQLTWTGLEFDNKVSNVLPIKLFQFVSDHFFEKKYVKIDWKLMINQEFKIVFQINQPANIPQKWFHAKNGPFQVSNETNPNRVGF